MTISRKLRAVLDPLGSQRTRVIAYAVIASALALLCLFPRPWMARAKVVPGDPAAGVIGSGGFGAGGGSLASLFGDRSFNEVALQLARSEVVTQVVIVRLDLAGPGKRYESIGDAQVALGKQVDIHSLLGGIIEVETKTLNSDLSLALTRAYVKAISERVGNYGRDQAARKRRILDARLSSARDRLARAQADLDAFRRTNQLADPQVQLGAQLALRTQIEAQLRAREVELQTLQTVAGPENSRLKYTEREVAALKEQLARAAAPVTDAAGPNVGELAVVSLRYASLYRAYLSAQAIQDVYVRVGEELAAQEMSAQDRTQVTVVDAPHLDAERAFNTWAVALLALVLTVALFTEVYAPFTGLWKWEKTSPSRDPAGV